MIEVRRASDGGLCGHDIATASGWRALTVFGGTLGVHDHQDAAEAQVLADGPASMPGVPTVTLTREQVLSGQLRVSPA